MRAAYVHYMEFSLHVVADPKPTNNPKLKRFSLVFSSPDGDITIAGCLFNEDTKQVDGTSFWLKRQLYNIVKISPVIQDELRRQFARRDFSGKQPERQSGQLARLKSQGFGFEEFRNAR